jgi:hypothetical protein
MSKKIKIVLSLVFVGVVVGGVFLISSESVMGRLKRNVTRPYTKTEMIKMTPFSFFNFNFTKMPSFSINDVQNLSKKNLVEKKTVDITSRNGPTGWVEATSKYDAYSIPEGSFRVVCEQPCEIPENIMEKKTEGVYKAIKKLLALTKADVLQGGSYNLKPVDIHLTSSTECGQYTSTMNAYAGSRPSGLGGSYICTWAWDRENSILPINPLFAAAKGQDAESNAVRLESQGLVVHEYTHILFYVRSYISPESFTHTLQKHIAGTWDGSGYNDSDFPKIKDACDPSLNKGQTKPMYNLCTKCGFSLGQIGPLLRGIDEVFKNGEGESDAGKVSMDQINKILSEITGTECVYE